jgi:hypothetical protein
MLESETYSVTFLDLGVHNTNDKLKHNFQN